MKKYILGGLVGVLSAGASALEYDDFNYLDYKDTESQCLLVDASDGDLNFNAEYDIRVYLTPDNVPTLPDGTRPYLLCNPPFTASSPNPLTTTVESCEGVDSDGTTSFSFLIGNATSEGMKDEWEQWHTTGLESPVLSVTFNSNGTTHVLSNIDTDQLTRGVLQKFEVTTQSNTGGILSITDNLSVQLNGKSSELFAVSGGYSDGGFYKCNKKEVVVPPVEPPVTPAEPVTPIVPEPVQGEVNTGLNGGGSVSILLLGLLGLSRKLFK